LAWSAELGGPVTYAEQLQPNGGTAWTVGKVCTSHTSPPCTECFNIYGVSGDSYYVLTGYFGLLYVEKFQQGWDCDVNALWTYEQFSLFTVNTAFPDAQFPDAKIQPAFGAGLSKVHRLGTEPDGRRSDST
jgi:hypothetical protein